MALITKTIVACNKCGKEVVWDGSNVRVLDEEFYLCDECLERLINWLTVKPEPVVEEPETNEVTETVSLKEVAPIYVEPKERPTTYMRWDDYNIDRLLNLWGRNYTAKECAAFFKIGKGSINKILDRIRKSAPGSDIYQHQARLRRLDLMRRGKTEEQEE